MKKNMIILLNIALISSRLLLISADYSYENAEDWPSENPQCGGSRQSPVDASFDDVSNGDFSSEMPDVKFEHILTTVPERMILKNDGHTVKLLLEWAEDEKKVPHVSSNLFEEKYTVHSFQFRWSSDVNSGSEHLLAGKSYPMEMQIVHYNDEYDSYEEAENTEKGLLIHSMFFEIGSDDFDFLTELIDKFPEVTEPGTSTELEPFAMGDFFDDGGDPHYLIYDGSLTYPPCYETVVWVLSTKLTQASAEQIKAFQKLNLLNRDNHNNRPVQDLDGRKFTFSY